MLDAVRDKLHMLNKPIKLDRADGKVRMMFEDVRSSALSKDEQAQASENARLLRHELTELLSRCPGAREVLPHLAGLERALKVEGLAAFETLPPRVLQRAGIQLESVLNEPVSITLAELRSRIGAALKEHERKEQAAARRAAPSSFLVDEKLQVTESSESDFLAVLEESRRKP